MIRRVGISIVAGALVTLAVLFLMQTLIATARGGLDESGTRQFVEFVRVEREEVTEPRERRKEKPAEPEAPPPDAFDPRVDAIEPGEIAVGVSVPAVELEMSITGLGLAASDGEYLPVVKIAPMYPMSARTRGIEGYCIVEYTVTAAGTVKDAVVVEADPKNVFDRVSMEAALKFKYRPRVVNGEPIAVRGVRHLFRFVLEPE